MKHEMRTLEVALTAGESLTAAAHRDTIALQLESSEDRDLLVLSLRAFGRFVLLPFHDA